MTSHLVNVLLLGLAFHLIFFAFFTATSVQQTVVRGIKNFGGDAYVSSCILYLVFALSNWIAPSILALTGSKLGMSLGALTYALYSLSFIFPTTATFYSAAGLLGLGAAVLWTGQGSYLAANSNPATSIRDAGVFWSLFQASSIFGNAFLWLIITNQDNISDHKRYVIFGVLTGVTLAGLLVILCLPGSGSDANADEEEESPTRKSSLTDNHNHNMISNNRSNIKASTTTIVTTATATTTAASKTNIYTKYTHSNSSSDQLDSPGSLCPEVEPKGALHQFQSAIRLAITPEMMLLVVTFAYTGILMSMYQGILSTSIGSTKQFGKKYIGLAGLFVGLGEIVGGSVFGLMGTKLSKWLKRSTIVVLGYFVTSLSVVILYLQLPPDAPLRQVAIELPLMEPELWISMTACFLVGLGDACYNTQVYAILVSAFVSNPLGAFALHKFGQSIGAAVSFLYSTRLDLHYQLWILLVTGTVATVTFVLADTRCRVSEKLQLQLLNHNNQPTTAQSVRCQR